MAMSCNVYSVAMQIDAVCHFVFIRLYDLCARACLKTLNGTAKQLQHFLCAKSGIRGTHAASVLRKKDEKE